MSTKAELAKLLDDAHKALHKIEGVAVNEVNRVEDAIKHAVGAVDSMPEAKRAEASKKSKP
jgi:hypothetical protein